MAASNPDYLTPRERRAREKAKPELDRLHREIFVGRPYGQRLLDFLRQNGIRGLVDNSSFCDVITLGSGTDLDKVDDLIAEWMDGADFQQP
jgi:hypothetical protein